MNEKLKGVEELKNGSEKLQSEKLVLLNDQITNYKTQVKRLEKKPAVNWVYIIEVLIMGLIIGYLLHARG